MLHLVTPSFLLFWNPTEIDRIIIVYPKAENSCDFLEISVAMINFSAYVSPLQSTFLLIELTWSSKVPSFLLIYRFVLACNTLDLWS